MPDYKKTEELILKLVKGQPQYKYSRYRDPATDEIKKFLVFPSADADWY